MLSVDQVVADSERLLKIAAPDRDVTDQERQIARQHASMMCELIAQCEGDKQSFIESMATVVGTARTFGEFSRMQVALTGDAQALAEFDKHCTPTMRKEDIQLAVHAACTALLDDEDTQTHTTT